MPRATVWIRNEDWEQWQAIDKKAEWLHNHLNADDDIPIDGVRIFDKPRIIKNKFNPVVPDDPKYEPMDN